MDRITVKQAAIIFGKDPNWVRAGIIEGWLPIGIATRNGRKVTSISQQSSRLGRINYYISQELLERLCSEMKIYNEQQRESCEKYYISKEKLIAVKALLSKYRAWKELEMEDIYAHKDLVVEGKGSGHADPTFYMVATHLRGDAIIFDVESAAKEASEELSDYILMKAQYGYSSKDLHTRHGMRANRDDFFDAWRHFIFILSSKV